MGAKFLAVLEGRKMASLFEMKARITLSLKEEERAVSPISKQASTGDVLVFLGLWEIPGELWLLPDGGGEERRRKRSKKRG